LAHVGGAQRVERGQLKQPPELFASHPLARPDVAVALKAGKQALDAPGLADRASGIGDLVIIAGDPVVLQTLGERATGVIKFLAGYIKTTHRGAPKLRRRQGGQQHPPDA
jgi:hypothetical protein